MFIRLRRALVALSFLFVSGTSTATTIDFESFTNGQVLTNQISGLTFQYATILSAGQSLNEIDYPPHSGSNVVVNTNSLLSIDFATPVTSIQAYLTYNQALFMMIFDANNVAVGQDSSNFAANYATLGQGSPNELFSLSYASGFNRVVFSALPSASGSFVIDDLSFTSLNRVPEPTSLALVLIGLLAAGRQLRKS